MRHPRPCFDRIGAPLNSEPIPVLQWIEVASALQIPSFHIVGLPGPEVAEARERVKAALEASGFEFPRRRLVLNLSPASIRKRGTGLDLAMALAVLFDQEDKRPADESETGLNLVAWGELGLDGTVKPAGQITRTLYACWHAGVSHLLISHEEETEARVRLEWIRQSRDLDGAPPELIAVRNLSEAWKAASKPYALPHEEEPLGFSCERGEGYPAEDEGEPDPELIRGLMALPPSLERIIGISASGNHHLLLLGPRGTGKSHALEWLIALQPPVSPRARLHAALLSELGNRGGGGARPTNPYSVRRVSAQAKPSALLGGATPLFIRPGEFSLAHGGLLIADELPEWARDSREALREPLERGRITLTRTNGTLELPARFTLAANGNLCPCGGWPPDLPKPPLVEGRRQRVPRCKCTHGARKAYLSRLSGPVLDRIDLVFIGASLPPARTSSERSTPSSARELFLRLRAQVRAARELTRCHWGIAPALLPAAELEALLDTRPSWIAALDALPQQSLRARHKVLRVAMSLAAWDGHPEPLRGHFIEASCYRPESFGIAE
ncbi:MAG: ATP-binding protein [Oligoflexia bacterium]|nr:ATP-binding protein [Oligoflexia bacterium]